MNISRRCLIAKHTDGAFSYKEWKVLYALGACTTALADFLAIGVRCSALAWTTTPLEEEPTALRTASIVWPSRLFDLFSDDRLILCAGFMVMSFLWAVFVERCPAPLWPWGWRSRLGLPRRRDRVGGSL